MLLNVKTAKSINCHKSIGTGIGNTLQKQYRYWYQQFFLTMYWYWYWQ